MDRKISSLVNSLLNHTEQLPLLFVNWEDLSGSHGRSRDLLSSRGCFYSISCDGYQQMKTPKDLF